jgi:integrase/recombinase XerC
LKQLCDFLKISTDQFSPDFVEVHQIQQWTLALLSNEISARSLSRKISTLKSFWRFLLARGYTSKNPTLKIILPKTKKPLPAFFKDSEMENALNNTFLPNEFEKVRNRLIINSFYSTGIRLSELISIQDKDVDVSNGSIRVIGKRNKQRIIPISPALSEEIEQYITLRNKNVEKLTTYLFVRQSGKKMYPKMIYRLVHNTMSEVSSLHKKSPHILRHTFATSLMNGGADINVLKELLGHSSLAATQVYTHTSFEELYTIYKQAHPRA